VIEMARADGSPAAFIAYEVKSANGEVKRGLLDADGRARLDGLPAGSCEVSFPEIDGREWDLA
jgi:hypothetical protein